MQKATPLVQSVEQEYQIAQKIYNDPGAKMRRDSKMSEIYAAHQCQPWKLFAFVVLQAPLFISYFFAVKGLAERFPSFVDGGTLWFPDLSVADPFFLLPVAAGLSLMSVLEVRRCLCDAFRIIYIGVIVRRSGHGHQGCIATRHQTMHHHAEDHTGTWFVILKSPYTKRWLMLLWIPPSASSDLALLCVGRSTCSPAKRSCRCVFAALTIRAAGPAGLRALYNTCIRGQVVCVCGAHCYRVEHSVMRMLHAERRTRSSR